MKQYGSGTSVVDIDSMPFVQFELQSERYTCMLNVCWDIYGWLDLLSDERNVNICYAFIFL